MKTCIQPMPHPEKVAEVALNPQGGVSGKERMRVYADGYLGRMHEAAFHFFAGIQSGEVLGSLFQALAQNEEQDTAEVQHWFTHWSALGLFSGFEILAGETRPV